MNIKKLNEKLEQLLEEQFYYQIYDDEWEDETLLTKKGVIKFAEEHLLDRLNDLEVEWDWYIEKYGNLKPEEQEVKNIAIKIDNNKKITFEEAKKLLKKLDFQVRKRYIKESYELSENNKEGRYKELVSVLIAYLAELKEDDPDADYFWEEVIGLTKEEREYYGV